MKKSIPILLILSSLLLSLSCAAQSRLPINRGYLQSNLDGNLKSLTNAQDGVFKGEVTAWRKLVIWRPDSITNIYWDNIFLTNMHPYIMISCGEQGEMQISDSLWVRGSLVSDFGFYGDGHNLTNANPTNLFGAGIIPLAKLGVNGVLSPNGVGLTQTDVVPTNLVPVGSAIVTNWLTCNLGGIPYYIATNRAIGGWQYIKMTPITPAP